MAKAKVSSLPVERGRRAWEAIKKAEGDMKSWWLDVGEALLVGRAIDPRDNHIFSAWCEDNGFGDMNPSVRSDAMWAARNPDSYFKSKSSYPPNARTEHRKAVKQETATTVGCKSARFLATVGSQSARISRRAAKSPPEEQRPVADHPKRVTGYARDHEVITVGTMRSVLLPVISLLIAEARKGAAASPAAILEHAYRVQQLVDELSYPNPDDQQPTTVH